MSLPLMLVMSVVWMTLTGRIAEKRGRSVKLWRALGFFFGLFALITVALLPKKSAAVDAPVANEPVLVA